MAVLTILARELCINLHSPTKKLILMDTLYFHRHVSLIPPMEAAPTALTQTTL